MVRMAESLKLTALADIQSSGADSPRIEILAYNRGAKLRVSGWKYPVVLDLSGMKIEPEIKLLTNHDTTSVFSPLGTGTASIEEIGVRVSGLIQADTATSRHIVQMARNGYKWQASVGLNIRAYDEVKAGKSVDVGGVKVDGPAYIARDMTLFETSIVVFGADRKSAASIFASGETALKFGEWLLAAGFVEADLSDEQKSKLQAAFDAEADSEAKKLEAKRIEDEKAKDKEKGYPRCDTSDQRLLEAKRDAACYEACGEHKDLYAKSLECKWDADRCKNEVELKTLRASRVNPGSNHKPDKTESAEVIECALLQAVGLPGVEDHFDEKTLEAAHKNYRGGMGLQEFLLQAAHANGYRRAAWRNGDIGEILTAAFSSISLPGILGNVANKFILDSFNSVEDSWRKISAVRNVSDFKTVTSYRMTGDMQYEKVGPGGEIKDGKVDETGYENKAETYAKGLSITRQMMINDDLGAFTSIAKKLGRGAALKLNNVFWTEFLADAVTFWTAGRGNYQTGAATTVSVAGLTTAETLFLNQVDEDSQPLAIEPRILLVPNALRSAADVLMSSMETGRDDEEGNKNPHSGKYEIVRSSYLSNAAYTGQSALAWYLLASPQDLPVIETCFLDGRQAPTVESSDAEFSTLGMKFRGYFDFGVKKQEYRGGVKSKGEN